MITSVKKERKLGTSLIKINLIIQTRLEKVGYRMLCGLKPLSWEFAHKAIVEIYKFLRSAMSIVKSIFFYGQNFFSVIERPFFFSDC